MTMTAPAIAPDVDERHRPQLVVLPPLRLEPPPTEADVDDDARYWLTARGAIVTAGLERVCLVPGLEELVRWSDDTERWVRL